MFIIEHDMNFVLNLADEVIVMDEGKVIARVSQMQSNAIKGFRSLFGRLIKN